MSQPPLLLALKAQFPSPMKRASHEGDIVDIAHSLPTPTVEDRWISSGKFMCKISMNNTLPKTNMDTQNDGLEKVTPFEHGNFWYLC